MALSHGTQVGYWIVDRQPASLRIRSGWSQRGLVTGRAPWRILSMRLTPRLGRYCPASVWVGWGEIVSPIIICISTLDTVRGGGRCR